MDDPYRLHRFVGVQNSVFAQVLGELRRGRKTGHWMWFVFPQIKGLGHSRLAAEFAISSRQEAEAYLKHPVLGSRLTECTRLVNLIDGRPIDQIFCYPDYLKFRSCMTLFAHSTEDNQLFDDAVRKFLAGDHDAATLERPGQPVSPSASP